MVDETFDRTACGADIAIVAVSDWLAVNYPIHMRLIASGLNVICIGAETSYPDAVDPESAAEFDRADRANNVTLTGCGLWDAYRLWSLRDLAGSCTAIKRISHRRLTDDGRFGAEVMRMIGVGGDPKAHAGGDKSIYRVFLHQAVASLGLDVRETRVRTAPTVSRSVIECEALGLLVGPGQVTGSRTLIEINAAQGVTAQAAIDLRLTEPGEGE